MANKVDELLTRGVAEAIEIDSLSKKLSSGKTLRVKLGIDPTSPNIHLGRSVPLLKLKDFQDLGHKIILIVGDFTGQIGDTSDKDSERPMLTESQVKENMRNYIAQAGKIINLRKAEIYYNSRWLRKVTLGELGKMADAFSVADFISRENVKKRLDQGKRVSLRETLYPLMQGYDSVMIKADVEIGGTDQRFNMLAGRKLQPVYNQAPQDVVTCNLIMGIDGRKMSSSWGNTINLTDSAEDMFGKMMKLSDEQIIPYFIHCTRVEMGEVDKYVSGLKSGTNPRDIKQALALEVTKMYHGDKMSDKAQAHFVSVFQQNELPEVIDELELDGKNIADSLVIAKIAGSKSEARRLLDQKSVKVNDEIVTDPNYTVKSGQIIRKGKRFFVKVK